jgi:aromatic-L-amino-acid decarboxylase
MALDPENWSELRRQGHLMLEGMLDHLEHIGEQPLWLSPVEASRSFKAALPSKPSPLDDVYRIFQKDILPYGSGNLHPGFMGWVQGAGSPVGMLAEMLAAGMNVNAGGRNHMAIAVEQQITAWVRGLFGFPETAQGLFLTGASQANFVALLLARMKALGVDVRRTGVAQAEKTLVAYASREVHGCVARAMDMAGLGSNQLRLIDVDAQYRMDTKALGQAIADDRRKGLTPFLLIGSAGTVNVGSIDDLDALADIAAQEGLTFHVDGALGALAVMSAELKPRLKGIERCDSLAFDFHKWGHVPYDAGFILVRDGALQKAAFASESSYLTRSERGLAAGDWWPCDYGPDLSRGFKALKTWFTLKTYGTEALGAEMAANCALARQLADIIQQEDELELLAPVALNIVCFSYRDPRGDQLNRLIVEELHLAGEVAPSLTILNGRSVIRAAIVNHRSRSRDIEYLVQSTLALGRSLASSLQEKKLCPSPL